MIEQDVVDAYSNKMAANFSDIRKMTPAQQDRVKATGSSAENLLQNREFVLFVRQFQLETMDAITDIRGHLAEDNAHRVALTQQLVGIENFIAVLKRARQLKDRVVSLQQQKQPAEEAPDI
jgi:hypothetical protein